MNLFDLFRPKKIGPDEAVLTQLRKAGSNLSKPHPVEFFLYFPTAAVAQGAAEQIRASGFEVKVKPSAKGADWLCFATKTIVPSLSNLQEIREKFTALANSVGGEYDGWGTPIVN